MQEPAAADSVAETTGVARRGTYRKGREKREEILRVALETFAEQGYRNSSIRQIAQRVDQNVITTTRPRSSLSSTGEPSSFVPENAGAAEPILMLC